MPEDIGIAMSSGFAALDAAAALALRQWRFVPATRGGMPVASSVRLPIRFALAASVVATAGRKDAHRHSARQARRGVDQRAAIRAEP